LRFFFFFLFSISSRLVLGQTQWVPGFFPEGKSDRVVKYATHLHLVPRLRISGFVICTFGLVLSGRGDGRDILHTRACLVMCVLVFTVFCIVCTVFLYSFVYVYLFLFALSVLVLGLLPSSDNSVAVSK